MKENMHKFVFICQNERKLWVL